MIKNHIIRLYVIFMKHYDGKDFNSLIKKGVHIVDFFATWCGPCQMLSPILESIEDVDIIKVDIDSYLDLTKKYGIMSVPTLLFIKDGEIKAKRIGLMSKDEILEVLEEIK